MDLCRFAVFRFALCTFVVIIATTHAQVTAATPPGGNPVPWAAVSIHPSDPARDKSNDGWAGQPNGITARGATMLKLLSRGFNFGIFTVSRRRGRRAAELGARGTV